MSVHLKVVNILVTAQVAASGLASRAGPDLKGERLVPSPVLSQGSTCIP